MYWIRAGGKIMSFLIQTEDLHVIEESKRIQSIYIVIHMHNLRSGVVLTPLENQPVICLKCDYCDPGFSYTLIQIY